MKKDASASFFHSLNPGHRYLISLSARMNWTLTYLHIKPFELAHSGYFFSVIHIFTGLISKIFAFFVRFAQCLT
ncbi:hypothetical protein B7943_07555 [Vibrio cholerae]|nr:hypothetical protein B7943_07555 [Vibrio cholerae]